MLKSAIMAFNGITIHALTHELHTALSGGRISKIVQPEKEELLLTIKTADGNLRLLASANASLPLLYLTSENKNAPLTAPNFCMLLRKHIGNGRISSVTQEGLERVVRITIEHLDDLGDPAKKYLFIELMGKHSNIIFCDDKMMILDAIKHVGANVSSVREVLPGRKYFVPTQEEKRDALSISRDEFFALLQKAMPLSKWFPAQFVGFSAVTANELCYLAGVDSDASTASLIAADALYDAFSNLITHLKENTYAPCLVLDKDTEKPLEFSALPLSHYADERVVPYTSVSKLLEDFYATKNKFTNMQSRSADLRKLVRTFLDRNIKKLALQEKQLKDTEKMETYRLRGELLQAYAHEIEDGAKSAEVLNYYTNEPVTIPLDETKTAMENANAAFEKYAKLKRTKENLTELVEETRATIAHLSSIEESINFSESEADLRQIRTELVDAGFLRYRAHKGPKAQEKSKPLHFQHEDGFDIYVGKNNTQNDELTFKFATGNDWWFHSKVITGSHVILKCGGKSEDEIPDRVFEDAASLAGYFSSARESDKVEIDYVQKKEVKKPNGAAPGYVIYYTNYSMTVKPEIRNMSPVI